MRKSTPVFLAAGLNVISAANAALSTDYYVRATMLTVPAHCRSGHRAHPLGGMRCITEARFGGATQSTSRTTVPTRNTTATEVPYDAVTLGLNANPLIGPKRFRQLHRVCGQRPALQKLLMGIKVTR